MRRFTWVIALVMCLSLVLAGCGKKDAGSVVKDLDGVMHKLQSYQGSGKMVLNTGQEPQEYQVEVWYQNPHYYRISLTNAKKDITQIVLRNDDGVFVLTPHLNKSFRFQSDWPENQGQVYLYQSLVQSILMDNERQFTADPNAYVFDVLANYQNGSLARQKIWLDKKSYAPQHVEVSDANANVMVRVDFNQFEFGKKFEKDSFDMQRNMTSWKIESLPTTAPADAGKGTPAGAAGAGAVAGDGKTNSAAPHDPGTMDGKSSSTTGSTGAKAATGATGGTNGAASNGASGAAAGTTGANGTGNGSKAAAGSTNGIGAAGTAPGTTVGAAGATNSTGGTAAGSAGAKAPSSGANAGAAGTKGTAAAQTPGNAAGTTGAAAASGAKADASKQKAGQLQFGIIEPYYTPNGVKQQDVNEIKLGEEKAVMLRYSGKYNYTLVESRPETQTVSNLPSDIVDLGYTLAVITGDEKKTLIWTHEGIEFRLSTGDLPQTEMIKVAQAVQGEMGK